MKLKDMGTNANIVQHLQTQWKNIDDREKDIEVFQKVLRREVIDYHPAILLFHNNGKHPQEQWIISLNNAYRDHTDDNYEDDGYYVEEEAPIYINQCVCNDNHFSSNFAPRKEYLDFIKKYKHDPECFDVVPHYSSDVQKDYVLLHYLRSHWGAKNLNFLGEILFQHWISKTDSIVTSTFINYSKGDFSFAAWAVARIIEEAPEMRGAL